jgi:hypothetical protein
MGALTQTRLQELLHYNPDLGEFRWKVDRTRTVRAGQVAGYFDLLGYSRIMIEYSSYYAHRLAWLYVHGNWPAEEIDHINRVRGDNRLANLREATSSQNNHIKSINRRVLFKGVSSSGSRFCAAIGVGGRRIHLGTFDTPNEAHAAYCKAATEHFGDFAQFD